jgi:hypothetical protein
VAETRDVIGEGEVFGFCYERKEKKQRERAKSKVSPRFQM